MCSVNDVLVPPGCDVPQRIMSSAKAERRTLGKASVRGYRESARARVAVSNYLDMLDT